MKCIVLAAGYATRLYPLTENYPKPLLKVREKTILDWLVDDLAPAVDEFVVVSNHKYAVHFEKWASSKELQVTVVDDGTETNETRLGAVRDIQLAVNQLGINEDCLLFEPSEKIGKLMLQEMMEGGNFGQYDQRYRIRGKGLLGRGIADTYRLLKLVPVFPQETLWKIWNKIENQKWKFKEIKN